MGFDHEINRLDEQIPLRTTDFLCSPVFVATIALSLPPKNSLRTPTWPPFLVMSRQGVARARWQTDRSFVLRTNDWGLTRANYHRTRVCGPGAPLRSSSCFVGPSQSATPGQSPPPTALCIVRVPHHASFRTRPLSSQGWPSSLTVGNSGTLQSVFLGDAIGCVVGASLSGASVASLPGPACSTRAVDELQRDAGMSHRMPIETAACT